MATSNVVWACFVIAAFHKLPRLFKIRKLKIIVSTNKTRKKKRLY